jgi:hypothetical protein
MARNANTRHLIPSSLRDFLVPPIIPEAEATTASAVQAFGADPAPKTAPHKSRAPKGNPQLAETVQALRELYGECAPTNMNRSAMRAAVEGKVRRTVSLSTLDRARRKVWP